MTTQKLSAGSGKQPLTQLHILHLVPMWSTVNSGLPLLALPFFRVVYVDTDALVPPPPGGAHKIEIKCDKDCIIHVINA